MNDFPDGTKFSSAAILTHDGGVRAQTANFPEISDDEWSKVMRGLDEANKVCTGISLGGIRSILTPSQPGSLYCRTMQRDGGVVITKTWESVIVGIFADPISLSQAQVRVDDYGRSLDEMKM